MKKLLQILIPAFTFLLFSCSNGLNTAGFSLKFDPSLFAREGESNEESGDKSYRFTVAIMGENLQPILGTGICKADDFIEFTELPVGESAFVYANFTENPSGTEEKTNYPSYTLCSDDFTIKRGIQSLKLKLKENTYEQIYIDCETPDLSSADAGDPDAEPLSIQIEFESSNDNEKDAEDFRNAYYRVSFTISNGETSRRINTTYTDNGIYNLYCNKNKSYTVSDLKVDCINFDYDDADRQNADLQSSDAGTANFQEPVPTGIRHKVYRSSDTVVYTYQTHEEQGLDGSSYTLSGFEAQDGECFIIK